MAHAIDPGLLRDLADAKSAIARHGIVIIRAIEIELEPALMAEAKSSMASASSILGKMDEAELDKFAKDLRKTSLKTAEELMDLYTRLLARLGTEFVGELAKDLEGIGELFSWERISKTVKPVNALLDEKGFPPITLGGPEALSESFALELEQRWPPAFDRFKSLVEEASRQIGKEGSAIGKPGAEKKPKRVQRKG